MRVDAEPVPPWKAPPSGEAPVDVPVTALLATSHHAAVLLRSVRVHSNGVELELQAKLRRDDASDEQWSDLLDRFHEHGWIGRGVAGRLRAGVLLADGSRAIVAPRAHGDDDAAGGHRLTRQGGGGSGSDTFHDAEWVFWLWPLPPDGPLTLVVDWPAMDLPEQRVEIDGTAIRDAARAVVPIWPDRGAPASGTRSSWTVRS